MLNGLSHTDYGLIGYPLGHSLSKAFFTQIFAADHSGRSYDNFELKELTPEALYNLVLLNPMLKGFNVTAPYKEAILEYLDKVSDTARRADAVNTVKINRAADGRVLGLEGYNTDVDGFRGSLEDFLEGYRPTGALVLGTGGAAKAVCVALDLLGIEHKMVSRTKKGDGIIGYADIDADTVASHPLIINATPAGTYRACDTCPPFPYQLLGELNYCHDLVYNPEETQFMKLSAERGAHVKNGMDMLCGQALKSLQIWNS